MDTKIKCNKCGNTESDGAEFGEFSDGFSKPICSRCGWNRELARPELKGKRRLPAGAVLIVAYVGTLALLMLAGGLL